MGPLGKMLRVRVVLVMLALLEYLPSVLVLHPGALRTSPSMTKPLVRSSVMPGMSGYPTRRRSSRMTGIWVCRFLPGVW